LVEKKKFLQKKEWVFQTTFWQDWQTIQAQYSFRKKYPTYQA